MCTDHGNLQRFVGRYGPLGRNALQLVEEGDKTEPDSVSMAAQATQTALEVLLESAVAALQHVLVSEKVPGIQRIVDIYSFY